MFLAAADAGAEDIRSSEESIEVITPPSSLGAVVAALNTNGIVPESQDVTRMPKSTVEVEGSDAKKVLDLVDTLEELDDVQEVYAETSTSQTNPCLRSLLR